MKLKFRRIAAFPTPLRLGLFAIALLGIWLPFALPLFLIFRHDPNLTTILTMGLLAILFIVLLHFWGQYVCREPRIFKHYGLELSRRNGIDLLNGLSIGLLLTFALFALMAGLGWVQFQSASNLGQTIAEGFLSALGIGFAEELVFRGWLLDELERDYSPKTALWTDALAYATLHFLKPISEVIRTLPQFPGLIILGLALVWAKRSRRGRLGITIGLHAGLVWGYYILNIGQILRYTNRVSDWITGVDGNPVAGGMGILFISVLALWARSLQGETG
ncbi:CPBP family intramembrane glutamic endopeptidase [Lusitaniella coriacea]|uniref:CPBP family intramembrane glutamic endopeptidase n=1 Tax=Lusitaniella coriacea TaxID=1983105 RepID=UPI001D13CE80|nr:type II CAAX endopeptidase family protein [Lusitaniella coriacea]